MQGVLFRGVATEDIQGLGLFNGTGVRTTTE
jgi:hypothetical protein